MKLRQRWKNTSLPNKLLASASVLMALGTLFYAGVAIFQYRMMREQAETTRAQLGAMQEQSRVIEGQLSTMQDQANSMRTQTNTLNDSLVETRKSVNAAEKQANASMSQADTSRIAASAAQKSAQIALLTELPRLNANRVAFTLKPNEILTIQVTIHNSGNSTAYRVNIGGGMATGYPPLGNLLLMPPVPSLSESDIGAGDSIVITFVSPGPLSQQEFEETVNGKKFLYAVGKGIFYDGFRSCHTVQFCFFYNPKIRTLSTCPASIQLEQPENRLRCP